MPTTWKFVDRPEVGATVLLDMNDEVTWQTLGGDFFKLPSPPLRRSVVTNNLTDGGIVTAANYDLRELKFTLELTAATEAGRIAQMDALKRELAKPNNLLMYQPRQGSNPVFFRTLRSDDYDLDNQFIPEKAWRVECSVLAEPFAIGLRHDIVTGLTVVNDPANPGPALNANTSFETDVSGWTGVGGSLTRTTAQFHAGVASATITPDGVTATVRIDSANVPVTGGATYRAQGWLRCAVARAVNLNVNWFDASSVYITTGVGSVSVSANTWTQIGTDMVAPANAAFASIIPTMTGTPPATNILWADEIELRQAPAGNATFFDITGVRGDAPSPAFVRLGTSFPAGHTFMLAQRTQNNPTALTTWAQCELGTLGADTLAQPNDTGMSGAGNNYARTTFSTNANMVARTTVTVPTASSADALRGRYRVLLKLRAAGAAASVFTVRYRVPGGSATFGPLVTYSSADTNHRIVDLGIVEYPSPGPAPLSIGYSGLSAGYVAQTLEIQAQRNSGTSSLDLDFVYLVPATERLCSFQQVSTTGYIVLDGPNDMVYGMAAGTSPFGGTRTVDNAGGLMPPQGGLPTLVPGVTNRWWLMRTFGALVTNTQTVDVSYWPRWREVATS